MDDFDRPAKIRWKLGLWAFLATGAAGGAGYYAWTQRAAYEAEKQQLKTHAGEVESNLAQTQGNLNASQQELNELRKWKSDTAKRLQTFRDMSKKLQKMVDAGKLGVRVRDGRLVMRMPQDVLFPSGSAAIKFSMPPGLLVFPGSIGDWPCFAETITSVESRIRSSSSASRIRSSAASVLSRP